MVVQFEVFIFLLVIIVIVGQVFRKSQQPLALLLVITGMFLSFIPHFPRFELSSDLVLNIFLPILIYQISAFSSWKDVKNNLSSITLLSIGHVVFITCLIACVMHAMIPSMGWPLAFVIGAIVSPPDDVAIVAIAEKIRMPTQMITILEGEATFNDAAALTLFRFALVALATHTFSLLNAVNYFSLDVIGEIAYGLFLGFASGELRLRISNYYIHFIASFITPFLAYFPAEMLGGSGILATAVTGFVIGNRYGVLFAPGFRLFSRSIWPAIAFAIQSVLFLLVGLDMRFIVENIASIPFHNLFLYSSVIVLSVILGRFVWVYGSVIYFPRMVRRLFRKKVPAISWQCPFIVSWAGMRGAISLAAALAIPALPMTIDGVNTNNLIVFLVFCVITATFLLQGLSLPWILKATGVHKHGQQEKYDEHMTELSTRYQMAKAVARWLDQYQGEVKDDKKLLDEVELYLQEYKLWSTRLKERIASHDETELHDEKHEKLEEIFLLKKIIEVERQELLKLWRAEKINFTLRNKLLEKLDHRVQHIHG